MARILRRKKIIQVKTAGEIDDYIEVIVYDPVCEENFTCSVELKNGLKIDDPGQIILLCGCGINITGESFVSASRLNPIRIKIIEQDIIKVLDDAMGNVKFTKNEKYDTAFFEFSGIWTEEQSGKGTEWQRHRVNNRLPKVEVKK